MKKLYLLCLAAGVVVGSVSTLMVNPFSDRYVDQLAVLAYQERLDAEDLAAQRQAGKITEEEYVATLEDLIATNNQRRLGLATQHQRPVWLVKRGQ